MVFVTVGSPGCGDNQELPDAEDAGDTADATATADAAPPDADTSFPFVRCDEDRMPLPPLVEDRTVYDQEELDLWTVNLTVTDLAGFEDVNAGVEDAEVPVVFTEGSFGVDAVEPNATIRIRGGASRRNLQKNYKIELPSGAEKWRGQKEINLNKHMWDLTRIRNKMAFDLFQTVPDFTGLRTQFVHMFVNGEDYGLYTWIEEPDKRFLRSHGLDADGQLYKPVGFDFQPIDPTTASDPVAFALIVESKATDDHEKFLRMVAAVNDESQDIGEIVDTYFNRDNVASWLAVNVLLNNIDTRSQNFYLYSPSSCEGWYFLPWDYDGAWNLYGQLEVDDRERWERGLSNWWPVVFFERFLQDPEHVALVDARIAELSQTVLTDPLTAARIASYRDLVLPHITAMPDMPNLPGHHGNDGPSGAIALWEAETARITPTVSRFRAEYLDTVERPMPSRIAAQLTTVPYLFRWDDSYDLQQDPITYDFQISTTPFFGPADLVVEQLDLAGDETTVSSLPPGVYFWRVIIEDHKTADSWQLPFDPFEMITIP